MPFPKPCCRCGRDPSPTQKLLCKVLFYADESYHKQHTEGLQLLPGLTEKALTSQ